MAAITTRTGRPASDYRFTVSPDPDGGYVIEYPDLPGCMTQVESLDEVSGAAGEILELWLDAARASGFHIPEPVRPEAFSGKFVLRLPRSLHRRLAERAGGGGVSLNQLATTFIAKGLGRASVIAGQCHSPTPRLSVERSSESPRLVNEEGTGYDREKSPKRTKSGGAYRRPSEDSLGIVGECRRREAS
jgi:antitoxin HicB